MAGRKHSRGTCAFCGTETTKGSMGKHLQSCEKLQETAANAKTGEPQELLQLRVQDAYSKDFWLDLEMRADAPLKELDKYLRAIWLECCGHLSQFSTDGWDGKIAMKQKAGDAFAKSETLMHIYDFGTSSETNVELRATRTGQPLTNRPIALLARNKTPEEPCRDCGKPATHLCMECIYENNEPGFLCAEHVKDHPHDDYGEPIEIINSPRLGMCGYDGPAEPPY